MAKTLSTIRPAVTAGRRPVIMGILNVTPDSFSDGGEFIDPEAAVAQGVALKAAGADVVDVGGESTRPGASRIDPDEEQDRVIPVIQALVAEDIAVSIDTMNSTTAQAAVAAGARMINDVSGGLADPEILRVVAKTGVHYVASHWRGHSETMDEEAHYDDVVAEVRDALKARIAELLVWGISPDRIILDPGLGFAKTSQHNWALLHALPELQSLGYPILIGASRKRFLAPFAADGAAASERDFPTAIISALAAEAAVWGVRVHDIASTATAIEVWSAWHNGVKRG
jgi:dihydropteroate synthase